MLGFSNRSSQGKGGNSAADAKSAPQRLVTLLIEKGLIDQAQYETAEAVRQKSGGFIAEILIGAGYIQRQTLVSTIVHACKIPHLSLIDYEINDDALQLLPRELCERLFILPIDKLGRILTVAMADPTDQDAINEIQKALPHLRIKPILADYYDLIDTFRRYGFNTPNFPATEHGKPPQKVGSEKPLIPDLPPFSGGIDSIGFGNKSANELCHQAEMMELVIGRMRKMAEIRQQIGWIEADELQHNLLDADQAFIVAFEQGGKEQALAKAREKQRELENNLRIWIGRQIPESDRFFVGSLVKLIVSANCDFTA